MNPQGKGKIEWTDFTLSIVTGCEHHCTDLSGLPYCYADEIAQRIYKEGFKPTFRPERIGPAERKMKSLPDGKKVFMTDMGDLFGAWVPEEWIQANIDIATRHPNLVFQFLTKHPSRYKEFAFPKNCWLGTTIDRADKYLERSIPFWRLNGGNIKFVSFEPLLTPMPLDSTFDWAIIGEQTHKALTQDEIHNIWKWAGELIDQAKELNIPIFVKNQLGQTYKHREWPRER